MKEITDEDVRREAALIRDVSGWPAYPILPVKNITREFMANDFTGFIYDDSLIGFNPPEADCQTEITVFIGNVFALPDSTEALKTLPREVYASVEDAVRAGWIGD
jgi:hypothetical protein